VPGGLELPDVPLPGRGDGLDRDKRLCAERSATDARCGAAGQRLGGAGIDPRGVRLHPAQCAGRCRGLLDGVAERAVSMRK